MANPQKENGYTPIANELLEAICRAKFNATQLKIIFILCRYTYGFNRKDHSLSINFISKAANVSKRYIAAELSILIDNKVIEVVAESTYTAPRVIALNKNYDCWIVQQMNDCSTVEEKDNTTVEELFHTTDEELFHQERNNKTKEKQKVQNFFETVWKLYPEKKGKGKVSEKSKKALYELGYEMIEKCIDRYTKNKPDWQHFQNGSTFFNSGYVDYLDENFNNGSKPKKELVPISDNPEDWRGF